ncbi:Uncharacterized protein Rs2_20189 [Raphanus sativus]|nr:Uncharacterized protein Rs2_20189 [Raphanus sativus]
MDQIRPEGIKAAKARRNNRQGKAHADYKDIWEIKKEDLEKKEKLSKLAILDTLLNKKEPLSEAEEVVKNKLLALLNKIWDYIATASHLLTVAIAQPWMVPIAKRMILFVWIKKSSAAIVWSKKSSCRETVWSKKSSAIDSIRHNLRSSSDSRRAVTAEVNLI